MDQILLLNRFDSFLYVGPFLKRKTTHFKQHKKAGTKKPIAPTVTLLHHESTYILTKATEQTLSYNHEHTQNCIFFSPLSPRPLLLPSTTQIKEK